MKYFIGCFLLLACTGFCPAQNPQLCDCEFDLSDCNNTGVFNIFISYSRLDAEIAADIKRKLKDDCFKGGGCIKYWEYVESCLNNPYCDFENISDIIKGSEAIVVVKTPNWNSSPYCIYERDEINKLVSTSRSSAKRVDELLRKIRRSTGQKGRLIIEYVPAKRKG